MKNLRGFTFFTAGGKKNGTSAVRTYILYNTKPYNTALYVLYIEPGAANNWDYWLRAAHCCCTAAAQPARRALGHAHVHAHIYAHAQRGRGAQCAVRSARCVVECGVRSHHASHGIMRDAQKAAPAPGSTCR
jgi:hypothetical protein